MNRARSNRGVPAFLLRLRMKAALQGNAWAEREFPENYVSPEMANRAEQARERQLAALKAAKELIRSQVRDTTPGQMDAVLYRHLEAHRVAPADPTIAAMPPVPKQFWTDDSATSATNPPEVS